MYYFLRKVLLSECNSHVTAGPPPWSDCPPTGTERSSCPPDVAVRCAGCVGGAGVVIGGFDIHPDHSRFTPCHSFARNKRGVVADASFTAGVVRPWQASAPLYHVLVCSLGTRGALGALGGHWARSHDFAKATSAVK